MGVLSTWSDLDPEELAVLQRAVSGRDEAPLLAYLHSGHLFLPLMEATGDVLGDAFVVPGGSSLVTDGEWVWRLDLAAYVERYHLELPVAFVEHARSQGYATPAVSDEDLARIEDEIVSLGSDWIAT